MSKNSQANPSFPRVKIGVSSCLLGQEVRYNGGHKRDRFLVSSLSQFVDYVPVCPEVAIGLGIPRPPIRLKTGIPESTSRRIEPEERNPIMAESPREP